MSLTLTVEDISQVGEARRIAAAFAREQGLGKNEVSAVSIVVTELANNLHHYAPGGRLLLQSLSFAFGSAVEILSIDSGPGMPDMDRCLQDGYSTSATPGNGLGAVRRLSTEFDIFSSPPQGTVVLSRIHAHPAKFQTSLPPILWGAVSIPALDEEVCGDSWRVSEHDGKVAVLVADGLGHGVLAADAAQAGAEVFSGGVGRPAQILESIHEGIRSTRGAAVAIAEVNLATHALTYAGIGNISGTMLDEDQRSGFVSHNGIVGVQIRKVQEFEYQWPPGGIVVMHSDGLQTRWRLQDYPGLRNRHPAVIAGVLARDYRRGRDDLTVVVMKWRE